MNSLKLAVQIGCLQLPLRKALPIAARLGLAAIEIDARGEVDAQSLSATAIRQVRKLVEDHELRVAAVEFRTRHGYDVEQNLDRRVEATRRAMDLAHGLGAAWVVNQVGRVRTENDSREFELLCDVLRDLADYGHRCGAMLIAATGAEDGADLKRLIDALPSGALHVAFDPGNLIVNGFSATTALESLASHTVHVYARDGVRDLAIGRGLEVTLGRGSVDWPLLIATLDDRGYRGHWSIARQHCDHPQQEIAQAVSFLRGF